MEQIQSYAISPPGQDTTPWNRPRFSGLFCIVICPWICSPMPDKNPRNSVYKTFSFLD